MKRLKVPPTEVVADRGTQVTAFKVVPARRSASFGGPLAALVLVPAEPNATASTTAQNPHARRVRSRADSHRVIPLSAAGGHSSHLAEGAQHACRGSRRSSS